MKFKGTQQTDIRNFKDQKIKPSEKLDIEWVDVLDVQSPEDDLRYQGFFNEGAARFARGEGIWHGKDGIYFACTNGGTKRKGQILRYFPSEVEGTPDESTGKAGTVSGTER